MKILLRTVELFDMLRKKQPALHINTVPGYDHTVPFVDAVDPGLDFNRLDHLKDDVIGTVGELFPDGEGKEALAHTLSLKLLLEQYRPSFAKQFNSNKWRRNTCPFCGGLAGFARIAGEGRKMLVCHFCWNEWEYNRLACPFCEADEDGYALFESEEGDVRLDHCDRCKGYIKTILRELPLESCVATDLRTLFIDEWAQEKGYIKQTTNLIGIDFSK